MDDVWSKLDYTIFDNEIDKSTNPNMTSDTITNYDEKLFESKLLNSILTSNDFMCCGDEEKSSSENIDHQLSQIMKSRSYRSERNQISNSDNVIKNCTMEDGVNISSAFLSSSKKNQLRHQNMDDFEQLLDIANASSNIINKNLVFKQQINNDGQNETINNIVKPPPTTSTKSVTELSQASSSSGVSSLSSTSSLMNNKNHDPTLSVEDIVNNIGDEKGYAVDVEKSSSIEDFYQNMLDEIKTNWLHFRPKSPTPSSNLPFDSTEDFIFDCDLPYESKFAVELQTLNGRNEDLDNKLYLTEPLTKDLFKRNNKSITAQMFPVKTEPIEMTDFNDTSNVDDLWNVLLKNFIEDDFSKKCSEPNMVEKTEFCSEFYQSDLRAPESKRKRLHLDNDHWNHTKTGCSAFKLTEEVIPDTRCMNTDSNLAIEEQCTNQLEKRDTTPIKCEFPDSNNIPAHVIGNSTLNSIATKSQNIVKEQPKAELLSHKYILQYGTPMTVSLPSTISIPTTPTVNSSVSINTGMIATSSSSNTMYHQQLLSGTNTIISSAQNKLQFDNNTIVLAAQSSRKLNGPIDRNGDLNTKFAIFEYY